MVRSSAFPISAVYSPVSFKEKKNTFNKTAVIWGSVFGSLGVVAIIAIVWWLIAAQKKAKNKIYENIVAIS